MNAVKQTFSQKNKRVLHNSPVCDKILPVENGWLICPRCRRNRRVMKITPKTFGLNVAAFCKDCKWEGLIDIQEGQCFESRSQ